MSLSNNHLTLLPSLHSPEHPIVVPEDPEWRGFLAVSLTPPDNIRSIMHIRAVNLFQRLGIDSTVHPLEAGFAAHYDVGTLTSDVALIYSESIARIILNSLSLPPSANCFTTIYNQSETAVISAIKKI